VSPDERTFLTDEDEISAAPESGQPFGGRDNPWDDDDAPEGAGATHAFPPDQHAPPGDDL
jgi:hypothetical protein